MTAEGLDTAMNDITDRPSLTKRRPLTVDEILWFIGDADHLVGSQMKGHAQYVARFALEQIWAIERFEESSTRLTCSVIRLTRWLTAMTAILVVLTIVLTYFTIVLARKH
jgi:hypothetical protein